MKPLPLLLALPLLLSGAPAIDAGPAEGSDALPESLMRVEVVVPEWRESYRVRRFYGGVLQARRRTELGFFQSGVLDQVLVDEGDRVDENALLATLDARILKAEVKAARAGLETARARLQMARANLELAQATEKRYRTLASNDFAGKQTLDEVAAQLSSRRAEKALAAAQVERARAQLDRAGVAVDLTGLRAPFAGRIERRLLDEGAPVSPGVPVLILTEGGPLEVVVPVPPEEAVEFAPGATARLWVLGQLYEARVRGNRGAVDPASGMLSLLLELSTPELVPGMLAELETLREVPGRGFWVPVAALSKSQRGLWAILSAEPVPEPPGVAVLRDNLVEVLHVEGDWAFVTGTLNTGEPVLASGAHRVVPGQRIVTVRRDDTLVSIPE